MTDDGVLYLVAIFPATLVLACTVLHAHALRQPAEQLRFMHALDEGEFTEGHELPSRWKVAKQMIGRRLSQAEAKRLLAKLE
jgi:hypothetical protein